MSSQSSEGQRVRGVYVEHLEWMLEILATRLLTVMDAHRITVTASSTSVTIANTADVINESSADCTGTGNDTLTGSDVNVTGESLSGGEGIDTVATRRYTRKMAASPWPEVGTEGRWAVELMEGLLEDTDQSPEGLAARARELRAEADASDIDANRQTTLALADRYDAAAMLRLAPSP